MLHTLQSVNSDTAQEKRSLTATLKVNELMERTDITDRHGNRTILDFILKICTFLMPKKSRKLQIWEKTLISQSIN